MSQYWIANEPGSTITSTQAANLASFARTLSGSGVSANIGAFGAALESTSVAAILAAGATKLNGLTSQISTVAKAQNLGKIASTLAGAIDVKTIRWTSGVADPTHFATITISPTSRILVTTALASANGVVVNVANNKGQIKIQVKTSTGGTVNRYILLFSS